jgi:hypothetical protein
VSRARQYLEQAHVTYRHGVRHDRCLIGYPLPAPDASRGSSSSVTQAVVDHGLVWRFLGWLGALTWVLNDARAMILRGNPQSTCHRLDGLIDPHKARSPERLRTLETARQLLQVIPEWEACFGGKFFPRFATRAGFD